MASEWEALHAELRSDEPDADAVGTMIADLYQQLLRTLEHEPSMDGATLRTPAFISSSSAHPAQACRSPHARASRKGCESRGACTYAFSLPFEMSRKTLRQARQTDE
eukprot:5247232-Pleurochrysis_carterae.AAC.2